jgi:hypothetical protein
MIQAVGPGLLILLLATYSYFLLLGFRARDASLSPLSATLIIGLYTFASLMILVVGGDWRGDSGTPTTFSLTMVAIFYLVYAIGAIATMHAFLWTFVAYRAAKARPISKSYPRYLDYAYAVVMALGFAQILVFSTELARIYNSHLENEQDVVRTVKDRAQTMVDQDCLKPRSKYFTDEFCDKIGTIAATPIDQMKHLLLTTFVTDQAFMTHVTGTGTAMAFTVWGTIPREVSLRNPLAEPIARLKVRDDYESMRTSDDAKLAIGWLGLLVLPWGIGLRVIKTSMELFVEMVDPPPTQVWSVTSLRHAAEQRKLAREIDNKAQRHERSRKTFLHLPALSRLRDRSMVEDIVVLGGLAALFVWIYLVLPLAFYNY